MATTETKILDNIISSRRALLMGTAALAAVAVTGKANAAATVPSTFADTDILNFALNLEYLEANFYYYAAFGCTIDNPNALALAAGAPKGGIGIGAGTMMAGTPATTTGATMVPFKLPAVQAYAVETAIEEGKHVSLLRGALMGAAVAQPIIDVSPVAFNTAATAAQVPASFLPFTPYASDAAFLVGAYIFEDVGVSAYHGAAGLIKTASTLTTAASILAVEAYHAGLVRTTIQGLDPDGSAGFVGVTQKISALRATLSLQANSMAPNPDDIGLTPLTNSTVTRTFGSGTGTATTFVNADANVVAFARNTTQVLNIVTGGNAVTAGVVAKGLFFPAGLNGLFQ